MQKHLLAVVLPLGTVGLTAFSMVILLKYPKQASQTPALLPR